MSEDTPPFVGDHHCFPKVNDTNLFTIRVSNQSLSVKTLFSLKITIILKAPKPVYMICLENGHLFSMRETLKKRDPWRLLHFLHPKSTSANTAK